MGTFYTRIILLFASEPCRLSEPSQCSSLVRGLARRKWAYGLQSGARGFNFSFAWGGPDRDL